MADESPQGGQAGTPLLIDESRRAELVKNIAHMLSEWEDSGELYPDARIRPARSPFGSEAHPHRRVSARPRRSVKGPAGRSQACRDFGSAPRRYPLTAH